MGEPLKPPRSDAEMQRLLLEGLTPIEVELWERNMRKETLSDREVSYCLGLMLRIDANSATYRIDRDLVYPLLRQLAQSDAGAET